MAYEYDGYGKAWEWLKIMLRQEIEWELPLKEGTPNKNMNDAYKVVFNRMCRLEEEYKLDCLNDSNQLQEVYRKARAFDHIKVIHDKNVNEMSISDTKCIEMIGNELERADDEI